MLRSAQLVHLSIILVPRRLLRRSTDDADDPSPSETVVDNLHPCLTFQLQSGKWSEGEVLSNKIEPFSGDEPDCITRFKNRLSQKRVVTEHDVGAPGFCFFRFSLLFCGGKCAMHRSALGRRVWDSGTPCHWAHLLVGQLCRPTYPLNLPPTPP
jgi:hypothetical protein